MSKKGENNKDAEIEESENGQLVEDLRSPDASLDKVRDILFGQQSRTFDQKLSALEASLQQSTTQIHSELTSEIQNLERNTKANLVQEREEREISDSSLQHSLDKAAGEIRNELDSNVKDLRGELTDEVRNLNKRIETLTGMLQMAVDQINEQKLDRLAMASLLSGVAEKLRNPNS